MSDFRTELILATGFLTRLPVPDVPYSDEAMARATRLYPVVGLAIGATLAGVLWALSNLFPQPIAVLLTLAAGIRLTGALHEDGLADTGDGLGGGWTRAQALEIMRDSRIGTYGALALGLTLAIKATALAILPLGWAMAALVAGHALGRVAILRVIATLAYARPQGAGDFLDRTRTDPGSAPWAVAALTGLLLALWVGLWPAIVTLAAAWAGMAAMRRRTRIKLDGYTGDTLGATEQAVEALTPLALLLCL